MRLLIISATVWFLVDQGSKLYAIFGLDLVNRESVEVIPGVLTLILGFNDGINFGLFAGGAPQTRWLLVALAVAICSWLIWWVRRGVTHSLAIVGAGAIVGGAMGNSLDRVLQGAVVDFLNVTCCGIQNPFVFNLADVAIFVGAVALLIFAERGKLLGDEE